METVRLTRRHFAATLAGAMAWAKSNWPDRLGIMCQLGDSEKSARPALAAAAQAGFRRIQATFSWDKVTPAFLRDLPGWIRTEGLQCEALGAYVNCLNPDIDTDEHPP